MTGVLFVLPALAVLALLIVFPVICTGVLSVTNEQGCSSD
jgi:ABC-type sugar transport system permease subunit